MGSQGQSVAQQSPKGSVSPILNSRGGAQIGNTFGKNLNSTSKGLMAFQG